MLRINLVYVCFIDFQKACDSVWHNGMFINLILKSMALSYTPDSEHILEIARIIPGMLMPPSPYPFHLYVFVFGTQL